MLKNRILPIDSLRTYGCPPIHPDADPPGTARGFRRRKLNGASLNGANLSEVNLTGASFRKADLSGANLSGANLTGVNLTGADLTGANLTGANLTGVNPNEARLNRADLNGANLGGVDLSKADLCGANLSGANLTGTTSIASKEEEMREATRILQILQKPGNSLEMMNWHTCETSHCLAGWSCPELKYPGAEASKKLPTLTKYFPVHYSNEEALEALKRVAKGEESIWDKPSAE